MENQDLHQTLPVNPNPNQAQIKSKDMIKNLPRNVLWNKVMEAQAKKTWLGSWKQKMEAKGGQKQYNPIQTLIKTRSRIPRKNDTLKMIKRKRARRAGQEGSRMSMVIEKKVRTLKKLIPNSDSSVGLDGLFRDTAEYISSLEMRVRVMQAVVNALSNSE